jgi:hypothetical protein
MEIISLHIQVTSILELKVSAESYYMNSNKESTYTDGTLTA